MEESQQAFQRYFIRMSYDGKPFFGWQRQGNEVATVQQETERALSLLMRQKVVVVGAGRTDTGVHASRYYAHLDVPVTGKAFSPARMVYKLNRMLPPQIAIEDIVPVNKQAHARFSALNRSYQYRICRKKNPFERGTSWLFEPTLDIGLMQQASDLLLQHHDFACFSKSNTQVHTTLCQVMQARWTEHEHLLIFEIKANRFLRNMVRAIVGTLIEVGQGKTSLEGFQGILESRNRQEAGYSVPGHGLFLTDIEYPEEIWMP